MLGIALLVFRLAIDIQGEKFDDSVAAVRVAIVRRIVPGMRV